MKATIRNKDYSLESGGVASCDGKPLNPRTDIRRLNTEKFGWGDCSSGSAQLALAIMVNEFGDDLVAHPIHYQDLMRDFTSKLAGDRKHSFDTKKVLQVIRKIIHGN